MTLHGDSARWIWGSCDPLSTPRALGPVHDAARQVGGRLAERLFTGASRESIFTAVLDVIDDERRPTMLVIEDVHWADQATLDLLLFMGRRIAMRPAVVFATFRDDESAADSLFHATIGALPADVVHRIHLAPLTTAGVAKLAERADRSHANLHAITGGNPFFVTEMLSSEHGAVTPTIRDAVLARTRRLSSSARNALDIVAISPRAAALDLLERQLGIDLALVDESVRAGLLVAHDRAVGFRHELARLGIEKAIEPLRRRALNARVLEALVDRRTTIGDVPLARIVHHADAADDDDAIRRFAPLAAREAIAASAHREALSYLDLALRQSQPLSSDERAELLEAWSVEAYLCGRTMDAIAARRRALEIWTALGRRDRAGAALRWSSRLHWWAGNPADAERTGEEAVRLLESEGPGHELAMAYSNLSQLHMLSWRHAEAIDWGTRAESLARTLGDVEPLTHALTNVGTARLQSGDPRGAAVLEEAFHLAESARMDDHAQRALINLGLTWLELHEYERAAPVIQRALSFAQAHDLAAYAQYLRGQQARMYLERGLWNDAEREASDVVQQRGLPGVTTIPALVVLGKIQARRGDADAAATLRRARELAYSTRELQRIGPAAAALAEHAWLGGDESAAIAEAKPALEMARAVNHAWLIGELGFQLQRAGHSVDPGGAADPWRLLLEGDWEKSAALWSAAGCPYERADALATGDEKAMREALAIFDKLGATRRASVLRAAMRQRKLKVPVGPRRATRANSAGLTPRQMDVLRLVADGCTNQEIAERLNLTTKTVDHHVSAILEKLGATSRRAAAAAARGRGLLK